MPKTELFLGNLSREVTTKDIEDVFEKYGRVIKCNLKDKGFFCYFIHLFFLNYFVTRIKNYLILFLKRFCVYRIRSRERGRSKILNKNKKLNKIK